MYTSVSWFQLCLLGQQHSKNEPALAVVSSVLEENGRQHHLPQSTSVSLSINPVLSFLVLLVDYHDFSIPFWTCLFVAH